MTTTLPAGWKPIESAPKDGTEILAWRADCGQFIASYTSADAFPMTQDELDAMDEETLFAKDWFTQWPDATRLDGSEAPTLWQPLPAEPCQTCNDQGAVGNILNAEPCPDCSTPPASAQPARDWELDCDHCNGSGHVFVKHQVAERATDLQEFKEECECCEGRGFVFAFEDIPGIEEYVKACRPAPAQDNTLARTGNTADHQEGWYAGVDHGRAEARNSAGIGAQQLQERADKVVIANATGDPDLFVEAVKDLLAAVRMFRPAPAAGDARDAERLDFLANHGAYVAWSKDRECCAVFLRDNEGNSGPMTKWGENWLTAREAIDAAIAAQQSSQGGK